MEGLLDLSVTASAAAATPAGRRLAALHARMLACTRCVDAGHLAAAGVVLPDPVPSRVVLVGQAPGQVEVSVRRPFSGRSGRQLFRWLAQAGCGDEAAARRAVYLTSVTKCFPGPARSGGGDRRPLPAEIALCAPFLDEQLRWLRPRLILAVGQLALARFLPGRPLEQLVGRCFDGTGAEMGWPPPAGGPRPWILPLPHPSGASRWLNQAGNRELLALALERLRALLAAERAGSGPAADAIP